METAAHQVDHAGGGVPRTPTTEAEPVPLKKSWLWLLVASVTLSLAVPFALGGLGQFQLLKRLSWEAALFLTLLAVVSWVFNAWRTQVLMDASGRRVGFGNAALVTISAEFAGVSTPGAVGMPATYTFLFHNLGVGVPEAVGLVGLIMVTDLVFYGTLMPLAAVTQVFEVGAQPNALHLVAVIMTVIVGAALALWSLGRHYRRVCNFIGRQMGKVSWLAGRRYRLARATVEFVQALRLLKQMSWSRRLRLYLITVGFWLPRYLVLVVTIDLMGQSVPLSYLFLVQGVLNLGGQLFLTPGGGGTVDAGYAALLSPYMNRETLAFTLLVWRTYTFYWFLIVGGPIFLYKTGRAAHDLLSKRQARR
jgi:uncharacterized protein (TIRG00374 family)